VLFRSSLSKKKGFIGIDSCPYPEADIVQDLSKGLSFLQDNFVDEVYINHYLEYIFWDVNEFFKELYRVCKDQAKIEINTLYYTYYGNHFPRIRLSFSEMWFLAHNLFNKLFEIESISFDYLPIAEKLSNKLGLSLKEIRMSFNNVVGSIHLIVKCIKAQVHKGILYLDQDIYTFNGANWEITGQIDLKEQKKLENGESTRKAKRFSSSKQQNNLIYKNKSWMYEIIKCQEEITSLDPNPYYLKAYRAEEPLYWMYIAKWIYENRKKSKVNSCLDVGCAYGTLALFCKRLHNCEVFCIDIHNILLGSR